jgi:hypothetical protein
LIHLITSPFSSKVTVFGPAILQFAKYEHFSSATEADDSRRTTSLMPLGPKAIFSLVPKSHSLSVPLAVIFQGRSRAHPFGGLLRAT